MFPSRWREPPRHKDMTSSRHINNAAAFTTEDSPLWRHVRDDMPEIVFSSLQKFFLNIHFFSEHELFFFLILDLAVVPTRQRAES